MLQSYKGYFKDGKFFSQDNTKIPDNTEVIVTVLGKSSNTNRIDNEIKSIGRLLNKAEISLRNMTKDLETSKLQLGNTKHIFTNNNYCNTM